MKLLSRTMIVLGLLMVSGACATAQEVQWTLEDITFSNGNAATGSFVTDYAAPSKVWSIDSFSISVTGSDTASEFTAANMSSDYLPYTIGFANSDWSEYVDLYLAKGTWLHPSGGTFSIGSGFDCPGCGTLVSAGHHPEVVGVPIPEPSPRLLLIIGSVAVAIGLRRKLHRAT